MSVPSPYQVEQSPYTVIPAERSESRDPCLSAVGARWVPALARSQVYAGCVNLPAPRSAGTTAECHSRLGYIVTQPAGGSLPGCTVPQLLHLRAAASA